MRNHNRLLTFMRCLHVFFILTLLFYITATIVVWETLSTCFQRESVFINGYFLYVVLTPLSSFFTEMFQILITLWIIKYTNQQDLQIDKNCLNDRLEENPIFAGFSLSFFDSLVYMYTGIATVIVSFMLSILIYSVIDVFYLQPRRRRNQGLKENEIDKLPQLDFDSMRDKQKLESYICSICLSEFERNEKIVELPNCRHIFHQACVKTWLRIHLLCPYCRSNVRDGLQTMEMKEKMSELVGSSSAVGVNQGSRGQSISGSENQGNSENRGPGNADNGNQGNGIRNENIIDIEQ